MGEEKDEREKRERDFGGKMEKKGREPFFTPSSESLGAATWLLGRPPT